VNPAECCCHGERGGDSLAMQLDGELVDLATAPSSLSEGSKLRGRSQPALLPIGALLP
jgi:hypothetical protein